MNALNAHQASVLSEATKHVKREDVTRYLALKQMLSQRQPGFREEFRKEFTNFYGLNAGGVTETFKDRYFDILLGATVETGEDPYTPILRDLYEIPRRKGDKALQYSFVSKLVAMRDETRPLFDRYVSEFFGISAPMSGSVDFRIAGFATNMEWLRQTYGCWSEDERFQMIWHTLVEVHPGLAACAAARVADFLIYSVGREQLWRHH